jgi:hypothetical protein
VLVADIIFQPPRYRHPTSKVNRRFRSRGELSHASVQSPRGRGRTTANRQTASSQKVSKQKMTKDLRSTIAALSQERYFDVFDPDVRISHERASEMLSKVMCISTLPQNLRHCSQCNETNHNVRTCPEYLSGGR